MYWEDPAYRLLERLASFSRLILFDKRGMGLSDHVRVAPLEERMDDVRAVMDAVGSRERGADRRSEGGPMSILFAATYPERTKALILCGGEVKEDRTEDWPWGEATWEEFEAAMTTIDQWWGEGGQFWQTNPSTHGDEAVRRWWAKVQMNAMNPSAAVEFMRMGHAIDVRQVVPAVNVPTLVLHRVGDRVCHVENGRYVATHIDDARYVELPGDDHAPWVNGDDILAEVREFLTARASPRSPIDSLRRCCSPISLVRPLSCTDWETADGEACWSGTTRLSVPSSDGSVAERSTPPAMGSWRPLTVPPAPSDAQPRSSRRSVRWAWRSGPACTPASVRSWATSSWAWRSTSERAWPQRPNRPRCWSPARSTTWWPAQGSSSRSGGLMS